MGIKNQHTKVVNKIDQQIDFVVNTGLCPLRSLQSGKSQSVSLSLIINECKKRGNASWLIHVLINDRPCGIKLHPHHHILKMMRIVFRYKWRPDGSRIPIAEGVWENYRGRILHCCINWDKRIYVEIAEAVSTWENIREVGGDTPAARSIGLQNSPQSRLVARQDSGSWRKTITIVSSIIRREIKRLNFGGGRGIPEASVIVINSTIPVDSRRNRLISLRRRLMFTHFLIFCFAFTLVAGGHLFRRLRFRGN